MSEVLVVFGVATVALLAAFAMRDVSRNPYDTPYHDVAHTEVYKKIGGHPYNFGEWQQKVQALKDKAAALSDPKWREAYNCWISYHEKRGIERYRSYQEFKASEVSRKAAQEAVERQRAEFVVQHPQR